MVLFEADFRNEDTGECWTFGGEFDAAELAMIERFRTNGGADPDVLAMALALKAAYAELPHGFEHVRGAVRIKYAN